MKLSEAIRLGAARTQQTCNFYVGKCGETCALGAAYVGLFGQLPPSRDEEDSVVLPIEKRIRRKLHRFIENPASAGFDEVHEVIVSLNDEFFWSREAIADWLESIGY